MDQQINEVNQKNEELNKIDNIIQSDKFDEFIAKIFIYFIIGYIFISWGSAIFLFFYNSLLVPMAQSFLSGDISIHNQFVQQINSSNISLSEKTLLLNTENSIYQRTIQTLQLYTPIPTNQFIKDELILIVPPAIFLGLIYYNSKKENKNE
jgi:hypothetical protein